jgi:vacuolar protein sorting-associated protein 33A
VPLIHGKGAWGKQIATIVKRNRRTEDAQRSRNTKGKAGHAKVEPSIERILLLDRSVDPVTPFLTQWTYEGVLDEILSMRLGMHGCHQQRHGTTATDVDRYRVQYP